MATGSQVYCPKCKDIKPCLPVPTTELGEESGLNWFISEYEDIAWFRRGRQCQSCFHAFLTAEVDESLIHELSELRDKAVKHKRKIDKLKRQLKKLEKNEIRQSGLRAKADQIRNDLPWLYGGEEIPEWITHKLVAKSAWWLEHPSGRPVRAPKHAERLYRFDDHWFVDFGANSFVPDLAIRKSGEVFNNHLHQIMAGEAFNREALMSQLREVISRCVANYEGDLFQGAYTLKGDDLVFGVHSIDVKDVILYLISLSRLGELSELQNKRI